MRKCRRCDGLFPNAASHFYKIIGSKSGLHSWCKPCCRAYKSTRSQLEKRRVLRAQARREEPQNCHAENRATVLRRRGLTPERYEQMWALQEGVCAICQEPERTQRNGKTQYLAVDHDHITGRIRALLCNDCNNVLGRAKERVHVLAEAIKYLRYHGRQDAPTVS